VVVDPHRAVAQRMRDPIGARAVVRPHARGQAEYGVVGFLDCLRFSVECLQRDERSEDFLLAEESFRVAVFDERRRQERMPRALAAQQYAIGFVAGTGDGLIVSAKLSTRPTYERSPAP
jgi:hypothetical protein